ncbi:hypothetical protein KBD34_03095 [Patescibacteria group bacterium]|nr:hypothetical protein [Patescibacteria group bacterium]
MKKLLALFVFFCGFMFVGANVQAATFYRGFELTSTIAPDEMGFVPTNALLISGKKKTIKPDFFNLVSDLGGIRQQFAPRDPVNKSIVYFGTNHSIRAEGGQTGVFIVWKYNLDNGTYSRLYSLRYDPETKPMGYDIVGNEGTKLVILENIDGPHCPRDIPTEFSRLLRTLDMRTPAKGMSVYAPSAGMKTAFGALPRCLEAPQKSTLSLTTTHSSVTAGEATNVVLQAHFSADQLPAGSRLEIQEVFAGHSGTLIQRCDVISCMGTLRGEALTQGIHIYIAYILNASGGLLHQSETVRVDVVAAR